MADEISEFLNKVYTLSDEDNTHDALDLIFEDFDSLMWEGEFMGIAEILDRMETDKVNTSIALGFLCGCSPGRHHIPNWDETVKKVEKYLIKKRGQKVADNLLQGYK